jgi:ketosteroid isomerase-like protein
MMPDRGGKNHRAGSSSEEEASMDRTEVDRWLDAYIAAWKSYDRDEIAALFSDDVVYRYHPYDEPVVGREAVVRSWLGEDESDDESARDPEGTYDGGYRAIAVDGDVAVATGHSDYRTTPNGPVEKVFHNCFVIRFDAAGRCTEFTEWYMRRPDA